MTSLFGVSKHPKKYSTRGDLPPWWGDRTAELLARVDGLTAAGASEQDAIREVDNAEFGA